MTLATLILAAGESRRFKSCKLLAKINALTLIEQQLTLAEALTPNSVYIVVGAYAVDIKNKLPSSVQILENKQWQQGIGKSLSYGISRLKKYDAVLVLLGDQIALTGQDLKKLKSQWLSNTSKIVCAGFGSVIGVPAIFPKEIYTDIIQLQGDSGAKKIILNNMSSVVVVDMPSAKIDIDTTDDLDKFINSTY